MMRAAALSLLVVLGQAAAVAQTTPDETATHFNTGLAAINRDPTRAVAEFAQVDTPKGREWLAIALMMEARSPSDAFVVRAFESAARARAGKTFPKQNEVAARLKPGDVVLAFLVGETQAFAWAIDRERVVGYPLPEPKRLSDAVNNARAYLDAGDDAGAGRVAEALMPALLGPVQDRLEKSKRLIVVVDEPLAQLKVARLPVDDHSPPLGQIVPTVTVDYSSLLDAIDREPPPLDAPRGATRLWAAALVTVLLFMGGAALWRRRASA